MKLYKYKRRYSERLGAFEAPNREIIKPPETLKIRRIYFKSNFFTHLIRRPRYNTQERNVIGLHYLSNDGLVVSFAFVLSSARKGNMATPAIPRLTRAQDK